jgi:hypothetical protein
LTRKVTGLLVPVEAVTVMLRPPKPAAGAIEKVAVADVALVTLILPTTIPFPEFTANPATNPVPISVTGTLAPGLPIAGEIEVRVRGAEGAGTTVKLIPLLVPPDVVTVMLRTPTLAVGAIVKFAVADVAFVTLMLLTAIPLPAFNVRPETKPVPANETLTIVS